MIWINKQYSFFKVGSALVLLLIAVPLAIKCLGLSYDKAYNDNIFLFTTIILILDAIEIRFTVLLILNYKKIINFLIL